MVFTDNMGNTIQLLECPIPLSSVLGNEKSYRRSAGVKPTGFLSAFQLPAWVTRPERPKGAKDEVNRPEGPPTRGWGPEGPTDF